MEREITQAIPVLDENGQPNAGYSTSGVQVYERRQIKAKPWRIKEWDFYQISDANKCLQFTIGHAGYAGQVSLMLFDIEKQTRMIDISKFLVLPFGSLHMPENAGADNTLTYNKNGIFMSFDTKKGVRKLSCVWGDVKAEITLIPQNPCSLAITVPFDESPRQFYYNHKFNCMTAEGYVTKGTERYEFSVTDSFGLLDWGRGVWPFHNAWYWSNGSGYVNGEMFGFNLGCGFGNTETATENMVFYQGKAHKLGKVYFEVPTDVMRSWRLVEENGRLELFLTPKYDRVTQIKLLWVDNHCDQVFGTFTGTCTLEDGTRLQIENLTSFAEHAINNW